VPLQYEPKENCWDNSQMESFFSRCKVELIYAEQYKSIEEAKSGIFDYIEKFLQQVKKALSNWLR